MRIPGTTAAPLSALSDDQRLALGATLTTVGAAIITLSLLFGWTELARPWSFLLGLAGGVTAGTGVPLTICGLVRTRRRT